jgi:hypothetical protein
MALAVIGAGFGRTGTWSTFAALNRLGFPWLPRSTWVPR